MSSIVKLRDAIQDAIRQNIPDITHVDWHEGDFDRDDLEEITSYTPAAYVTILAAPADEQLATGEMNMHVRVCVSLVTSNDGSRDDRSADPQLWGLLEEVTILANLNAFGMKGCAPACEVKPTRYQDSELRRAGVAVGTVEWTHGLTIGRRDWYDRDRLPGDPSFRDVRAPASAVLSRRDANGEPVEVETITEFFDYDDDTSFVSRQYFDHTRN